ncbi:TonB-dependent receptor [candidate division KSB1 bacterium]|nr:TonB-dependent receptor [candidate division KSB1 bacterium]
MQELSAYEVTLVSRKKETLFQAAAAIYVITGESIRMSGATSIPEALRLVPGLQVARIDANKWAITSRGFIGRFSNKLLVLIDGRVIYNHLFSGVFWDMYDVMIEDIDHIEVIRGPGATLWGANAVNGIINIITKTANATQGALLKVGSGTEERRFGVARFGKNVGLKFHYRGYIKYFDRDAFVDAEGNKSKDRWDVLRGGARFDWDPSGRDNIRCITDIYSGEIGHNLEGVSLQPPYMEWQAHRGAIRGYSALMSWQHYFANASVWTFTMSHDNAQREEGTLDAKFKSSEVDASYLFDIGNRQQVIAGIGLRLFQDQYQNTFAMSVFPSKRNLPFWSAFIQDEIFIVPSRLRLTLGSKFEHNSFDGFEIQPNVRLLYLPDNTITFWGAVSRAVRTPSRAESGGYYVDQVIMDTTFLHMPIVIRMEGNPEFRSETLLSHEIGCRYSSKEWFSIDLTAFYNKYDYVFSGLFNTPFKENESGYEYIVFPILTDNKIAGIGYGFEFSTELQLTKSWQILFGYAHIHMNLHAAHGGIDEPSADRTERQCPIHNGTIQMNFNLSHSVSTTCVLRYMDYIEDADIPDYLNLDLNLRFRPYRNCKFSLVGQNLLHDSILEYQPELDYTQYTYTQRGVYSSLTVSF